MYYSGIGSRLEMKQLNQLSLAVISGRPTSIYALLYSQKTTISDLLQTIQVAALTCSASAMKLLTNLCPPEMDPQITVAELNKLRPTLP